MRQAILLSAVVLAMSTTSTSIASTQQLLARSSDSVLSPSKPKTKSNTWSGSVNMIVLAGSGDSTQFNFIDDENPTISSLDAEPEAFEFTTFFETFRLNYHVSDATYVSVGVFDTELNTNSLIENQSLVEVYAQHNGVLGIFPSKKT